MTKEEFKSLKTSDKVFISTKVNTLYKKEEKWYEYIVERGYNSPTDTVNFIPVDKEKGWEMSIWSFQSNFVQFKQPNTDGPSVGSINLFADAEFGKRYLTRDGQVAIYCRELHGLHYLVFEGSTFTWEYDDNGLLHSQIDKGLDIVKCLELTDDELKNIATQVAHKWADEGIKESNYDFWRECFECYKEGFEKGRSIKK